MLLIMDNHKTGLNSTTGSIFSLNEIAIMALPAHSTYLLQVFDVAVAGPLKTAFKHEFDRQIS
jgi:hypothetical protein